MAGVFLAVGSQGIAPVHDAEAGVEFTAIDGGAHTEVVASVNDQRNIGSR